MTSKYYLQLFVQLIQNYSEKTENNKCLQLGKALFSPQTTIDQMQAKYQYRNTGYAGFKPGALNLEKFVKRSDLFHICMLRGFFFD